MAPTSQSAQSANAVGLGLILGAGLGTIVGLLLGGPTGLALGAAFGAALGLVLGAVVWSLGSRSAAGGESTGKRPTS